MEQDDRQQQPLVPPTPPPMPSLPRRTMAHTLIRVCAGVQILYGLGLLLVTVSLGFPGVLDHAGRHDPEMYTLWCISLTLCIAAALLVLAPSFGL